MANVITKTYTGISEDNFESLSIEKNTTYTLNVKSTDGAAIDANNLTYTVDGDDAVVSYDEEYSISLKLSGTMEGTTEIPEGVYTFRLVHEAADDSKWVTTFKDAAGNIQTIKLQKADIAKTAADASLEQNTNIKGDFTTLSIDRIKDGVADEAFAATYKAAAAACGTDAAFNKLNNDNAKLEAHVELTLVDYAKSGVADTTMSINGALDLDTQAVFEYTKDGDAYTGSRFKESVTGTSADETFNMGTNTDNVTFKGFFGNDEITVNKGETIDLKIQTVGGADATVTKTETAEGLLLSAENVYTMSAKGQIGEAAAQDLTFTLVNTADEGAPADYRWACNEISELVLTNTADLLGADNFYNATGVNVNYTVEGEAVSIKLSNADLTDTLKTPDLAAAYKAACDTDDHAKDANTVKYNAQYSGTVLVKGYTDVDAEGDTATLTINNGGAVGAIENVEAVSNTYTGSWLNEQLVSTSVDETFALKKGTDTITFNGNFGNDTVYTVNNEALTFEINKGADLSHAAQSEYKITTNGSDVLISSSVNYYANVTVKAASNYGGHTFAAGDKINFKLAVTSDGKYVWQDTLSDISSADRIVISADDFNTKLAKDASTDNDLSINDHATTPVTLTLTNKSFTVTQTVNGTTTDVTEVATTGYDALVTDAATYDSVNKKLLGLQGSGTITLKDYAKAVAEAPAALPSVKIDATDLAGLTYTVSDITADYSGSRLNEQVSIATSALAKDLTIDLAGGANRLTAGTSTGNLTVTVGDGVGVDTITTGAGADNITVGVATNNITAGAGDDIITTTKGAATNTIVFGVGDASGANGDTVVLASNSDLLHFVADVAPDGQTAGTSKLLYSEDGSDLIITRNSVRNITATGESYTVVDKVRVKDFFTKEQTAGNYIKVKLADDTAKTLYSDIASAQTFKVEGQGVINGNWVKEDITTTGDSVINTGKGDDTVAFAKDSTNTVSFNVGDASGANGDIVTLGSAAKTVLQFNAGTPAATGNYFTYDYAFAEDVHQTGEGVYDNAAQLVITRTTQEKDSDGNNVGGAVVDKITLADYLKNGANKVFVGSQTLEEFIEEKGGVTTIKNGGTPTLLGGTFLAEKFVGTAVNDTISTGAGNDVIDLATVVGGNDTITLGAGTKRIDLTNNATQVQDITLSEKIDTLVLNFGAQLANIAKIEYTPDYTMTDGKYSAANQLQIVAKDSNGTVIDTINIKDYLLNGEAKVLLTDNDPDPKTGDITYTALEELLYAENNQTTINAVTKTEAGVTTGTANGSFLADVIAGSQYADTINGGDGDDVITAGAGDDEIFGGEGANVYHFGTNSGNDTVYMTGEAETLVFDAPAAAGVTFDMTKEDTYSITSEFSEDKKDVIITVVAKGTKDAKEVVYTDTVTLKNYMDGESQGTLVSYKEWDESTKTYVDVEKVDITALVDTASLIEVKGNKVTGTDLADNLEFDDNKSRTIYGLAGNDNIVVEGGKNTIYAGAGDDKIYSGAGADTIDGGEGNNMLYFVEGDGKDVVLDGAGNDTLYFTVDDESTFKVAVKGKDLVFTYGEKGDTVTVKDYAKQVLAGEDHSVQSYVLNGKAPVALTAAAATTVQGGFITLEAPDTTKPANLKGSTLAETLVGSEGNNVLNGGGGNDIIWSISGSNKINTGSRAVDVKKGVLVADNALVHAGIGNDVITAGKGNDTYVFQQGMLNGTINANTVGNVTIDLSAQDFDNLQFSIKGKDLVISNTYNPYGFGKYTAVERLYVKNYVNNKLTKNIKINDGSGAMNLADYLAQVAHVKDGVVLGDANAYKAQKLTGSFLNETFLGGAGKDTISTGAGQDTVFAGAGDDKITGYIAKVGKEQQYYDVDNAKTFVFDYSYDKDEDVAVGSGNDTIVNAKLSDTIVFRLADKNIKDAAAELAENLTLTQKGKNLIIGYNETVNAKGKTVYADSITLNNYFGKNVESVYSFAITDTEGRKVAEFDMDDFENGVLKSSVVTAIKTAANTAQGYDTNKSTVAVTAAANAQDDLKGNTTFKAVAGTGERTITDEKGNDTYNMTLVGQTAKTTINDSEGLDELVVTTQSTGFALFNVKADGTVAAGDTSMFVGDSANLTLDNKVALQTELKEILNLAGNTEQAYTIEVANQFKEGSVEDGAGAMEQVAFTNGGINARTYDVDAVKANVASWLTAGGYADTAAALENADNAATLLNLYMGGQA